MAHPNVQVTWVICPETTAEMFRIKRQIAAGMINRYVMVPIASNVMIEYVVTWKLHALKLPRAYFAHGITWRMI